MAGTALVTIAGYLAKDPEQINNEGLIKLTIPVTFGKDQKQHTDWYNVFINPNTPAARLNQWLRKGTNVIVSGRITADIWMDKSNTPHCGLNVNASSIDFGSSSGKEQTEQQIVQDENNKFNAAGGQQPQQQYQQQQNNGYQRQSNIQTNQQPQFAPTNDLPF